MNDLEQLIEAVDALPPDEWKALYRHMTERSRTGYYLLDGNHMGQILDVLATVRDESLSMTDTEVTEVINQAIIEVRREEGERIPRYNK